MSVMAFGFGNVLPFMETMTSPVRRPAAAAGDWATPDHFSTAATEMLLPVVPNVSTTTRARTMAMRKCITDPADATMIRWW